MFMTFNSENQLHIFKFMQYQYLFSIYIHFSGDNKNIISNTIILFDLLYGSHKKNDAFHSLCQFNVSLLLD